MKNLENIKGLQEMSLEEVREVNGGCGWFSLFKLVIDFAPSGIAASDQIRSEGGKTCADMPFK